MTNIAEIINENSTVAMVDKAYEADFVQRRRLGLSQVGHQCKRFLWYKHHGLDEPVPDGRVLRLFQLGNLLEDQIVKDLRLAGCIVYGAQKKIKITMDGITLTGSCDGLIQGIVEAPQTVHLWECKTMGAKGFKTLLKDGYEAYNPQYKGQIHTYMLGLGLNRAFVTVYNKDTSAMYQERIKLNKGWVVDMLQDVFQAIRQPEPPDRRCPRADWWEGKLMCNFYEECFGV